MAVLGIVLLAAAGAAAWWFTARDEPVDLVGASESPAAEMPTADVSAEATSPDEATDSPSGSLTESRATDAPGLQPGATSTPTATADDDTDTDDPDDADADADDAQPDPTPSVETVDAGALPLYDVTDVTAGDTLNVRSGPGTDNRVIFELRHDDRGVVRTGRLSHVGDRPWWEIHLPEGGSGWVSSRFLTPSDGEPPGDPGDEQVTYRVVGVAANDTLNARAGAGTQHPVVAEYQPDASGIVRTGRSQDVNGRPWWEVHVGEGLNGWVNSRFLEQE